MTNGTILIVFVFVYAGMLLGKIPGLALDRPGVALLGAIVLLAARVVSPQAAGGAIDVPTLANDIVCLAMAPIVVESCSGRHLDPVPFLLALAAASNVGSAATLIGNPQNMLVGQVLHLSFAGYLRDGAVPAAVGLLIVWTVIRWQYGARWTRATPPVVVRSEPFDLWQAAKGVATIAVLMSAFLVTDWPRDVLALGAAGVMLVSRKLASRDTLALVDWQLLVLFAALFVVNHALVDSGGLADIERGLAAVGIDVGRPAWLFGLTVVLSNLVSNVPAVMLLLPAARGPLAGRSWRWPARSPATCSWSAASPT